jgi:hypothetical protein
MQNRTGKFGYKRFSLYVASVLIVAAVLMCGGELYFGSLDGDLTRLGSLPERDFGWQQTQPLVEGKFLHSYPIGEADVLIVGDSFSASLVWQSQLVRGGLKPATVHWDDVKLCSEDFAQVIRQAGFSGRYVVIEAVERTLQGRMLSICKKGSKLTKTSEHNGASPPTSQPRFSLVSPRLGAKWVIEAMLNKFRYTYLPVGHMKFGDTNMMSLENGCEHFTNRSCNYGLFFVDEFIKLTFSSVNTVLDINRNLKGSGIQAIWLVVPDKSTVYLGNGKFDSMPYVNPWKSLNEKGVLGISDLDQMFIQESHRFKDLYAPNNTHLSPTGYLFLGDLMLGYIQNLEQPGNARINHVPLFHRS